MTNIIIIKTLHNQNCRIWHLVHLHTLVTRQWQAEAKLAECQSKHQAVDYLISVTILFYSILHVFFRLGSDRINCFRNRTRIRVLFSSGRAFPVSVEDGFPKRLVDSKLLRVTLQNVRRISLSPTFYPERHE